LFSFAFNVVDDTVLSLSLLNFSKPEFRSLRRQVFLGPGKKLSRTRGPVTKAGVDDIVADKPGLIIGFLAAATGLLAILRTINDSRARSSSIESEDNSRQ
jgi:hypothetical protein